MGKLLSFFEHFLRNPKSVGAVTALTDFVADSLLEPLRYNMSPEGRHILEAGAGMGNISRMILQLMGPKDRLDIVEIDLTCCDELRKRFGDDKRVKVHCGSILEWEPEYRYDFIVSTLPFNSFTSPMVKQVLEHYRLISNPAGWVTYVEYIGLHKAALWFASSEKKQALKERRETIQDYLDKYLAAKDLVYLNFLPCHIYHLNWAAETYKDWRVHPKQSKWRKRSRRTPHENARRSCI